MPRDRCYYDGQCGLCRGTVRFIRALDWLNRLEFRDMTKVSPKELPVPMEAAMQGMPMRTADGRVLVGFPAVRRALTRTPLGVLPAMMLYLPGLSWAGERVYRSVALRRGRDLAGTCPATGGRGSNG